MLAEIITRGLSGFDLYELRVADIGHIHQIDFDLVAVPIKIQFGLFVRIEVFLQGFLDDEVLEYLTPLFVQDELFDAGDAKKIAQQTRVVKI